MFFQPNPEIASQLPDKYQEDYMKTIQERVPEGTALYKVYASKTPGAAKVHIGNLVTTSPFVSSEFGDRYLFFRHQDMLEDAYIHPEWVKDMHRGDLDSCWYMPGIKHYHPKKSDL